MANTKLDRIERDIEKTRAKILEYQKRLKDLEAVSYTHLDVYKRQVRAIVKGKEKHPKRKA